MKHIQHNYATYKYLSKEKDLDYLGLVKE